MGTINGVVFTIPRGSAPRCPPSLLNNTESFKATPGVDHDVTRVKESGLGRITLPKRQHYGSSYKSARRF
jgi:hypothetical protein